MDKYYISQRIANIRYAKNISARKLSLELGQSSEYINQIENGRKMPSVDGLFNICEYFSLSLREFFDDGHAYPIQYKELIKVLNLLDESELALILQLAHKIADNKKV